VGRRRNWNSGASELVQVVAVAAVAAAEAACCNTVAGLAAVVQCCIHPVGSACETVVGGMEFADAEYLLLVAVAEANWTVE